MVERWRLKGEYLENCNCEFLCPCVIGPRNPRGAPMARPTAGFCDVPLVFQIDAGELGAIKLAGTRVGLVVHTPGVMGEGNWTAGLYLDERAAPEQRRVLESIFTGQVGGVMANLRALITRWLPTRVAPIDFGKEGRRRWARIPDVLEVEIEGQEGRDGKSEVWLENIRHFVSGRLALAKATRSSYRDHGFTWNNMGRNGHYASFEWSGP